jgi:hypothetical protein
MGEDGGIPAAQSVAVVSWQADSAFALPRDGCLMRDSCPHGALSKVILLTKSCSRRPAR